MPGEDGYRLIRHVRRLPVLGLVFWVLDRGHVIGGAFSRAPVPAVKPARAA
jgi:hypothetical protein